MSYYITHKTLPKKSYGPYKKSKIFSKVAYFVEALDPQNTSQKIFSLSYLETRHQNLPESLMSTKKYGSVKIVQFF